jgi:hypothetical protein
VPLRFTISDVLRIDFFCLAKSLMRFLKMTCSEVFRLFQTYKAHQYSHNLLICGFASEERVKVEGQKSLLRALVSYPQAQNFDTVLCSYVNE